MTWRHGFSQLSEVGLHWVSQGEGPLLLLLHGFPDFWYVWRKQIPALASHYRVVAPDLRGYNQSDKPSGRRCYRLNRLARDVAELIEDLGEQDAYVCGHDWGGAVAWATAGLYPQRLRKLAVLNCPHPGAMVRGVLRNPSQLRRSWYIFWFQLPWLPERMIRRHLAGWFRAAYERRIDPLDAQRGMEALMRPGALTAALSYYRAGPMPLPKAEVSALMLFGADDPYLLPSTAALSKHYTRAPFEFRLVEGCGHWIQLERPDLVNRELRDWFSATSS